MEWSDVRIFLAVVRGGSFGEAARALGVSHPTVGRRIKALEQEAQQPLLRRTSDGLVLTDAGDAVLALAESMENSALAMERRLAGNAGADTFGCARHDGDLVFELVHVLRIPDEAGPAWTSAVKASWCRVQSCP